MPSPNTRPGGGAPTGAAEAAALPTLETSEPTRGQGCSRPLLPELMQASARLVAAVAKWTTASGWRFRLGLLQGLVIAGRELSEEIVLVERAVLDECDRHDLLLRIDLAIRRGGAIPAELPDR